jgi:hypothetical protein
MNLSLLLTILFYAVLSPVSGKAATQSVGFSFGSPALLAVRGLHRAEPESPWVFQLEYSHQVLENNRTNGQTTLWRLDAQWEFYDWEGIKPFAFVGGDHLSGYLNKNASTFSLWAYDFGLGFQTPVTERLSLSGEAGLMVPLQGVHGFEFMGLIFNLGIRWSLN